jgi:hypothetical protein
MKAPDFDYGEYLQGRLGIVQPSYYDMFLFAAYRNLSGAPFTKEEIAVLNPSIATNPGIATAERERDAADRSKPAEVTLWHNAAGDSDWPGKQYPDPQGVVRSESHDGNYIEYYNCLPDAFKTARERLQQHRAHFGVDSAAVQSWLGAQRQVFENCGAPYQFNQPPKAAVVPVAATESDPPVIRSDRQYQTAAAHFYAGEFDVAANQFAKIAKDAESSWHELAAYLQARALIRKGTIGDGKGNPDKDSLVKAEEILKEIVADARQVTIRGAAQRRLDFIAARLHPEERRLTLAAKLTRPGGSANFDQDKSDYFWLLDRGGWTLDAKDDLTKWISAMKLKTPEATQEAVKQWKETKSLPWLVAAICKIDPARVEAAELVQATSAIPSNSLAHTTLLFHSLRLRAKLEKNPAKVITELDSTLNGEFAKMPNSAQNQFLALRMSLARNFEEFLRFAPRIPAGIAYTYGMDEEGSLVSPLGADKKTSPRFDADAATIFSERIPLSLLASASKSETMPAESLRMLTLAAWTRGVLLENDAIAQDLGPRLVQLAPELEPAVESYLSAKTPDDRAFAAVYAILRSPGMRPYVEAGAGRETPPEKLDNLRDNWWCSYATTAQPQANGAPRYEWSAVSSSLRQVYADGKIPTPKFLTEQDSKIAESEFEILTNLPSAPDWLGTAAIAFAKTHPGDPRVPEALHLVVRATRFGCAGNDTARISKAAFELLHRKYPESDWAKQTPYWYQ